MRTKEKEKTIFFKSIKQFLPKGYINSISEKLEKPLSNRYILYVLNEKRADNYGIKEIALSIALSEKEKQSDFQKKIAKLK